MAKYNFEIAKSDGTPGKVIIRQYTQPDSPDPGHSEDIEITKLEEAEYLRDQLNKIISELRVKYAGYEKLNS